MPMHPHAGSAMPSRKQIHLDYSLTGVDAKRAVEKGLAEADWYQSPVPRDAMRNLLERRDLPALIHTFLWFALIVTAAYMTCHLRGTWWILASYGLYCVIYVTPSDSRWHEAGHGTAFKTDWMNAALYEIASFMVMRESVLWRWSHNRHHSDTIIVGRDPEIAAPRPIDLKSVALKFFGLKAVSKHFQSVLLHAIGRMNASEKMFVPAAEFHKIFSIARTYVAIYVFVVTLAFYTRSFMPIAFIVLPNFFGTWLMVIYSLTQHAGLAENVLDHRLNCRTVYMNPINRFFYWNMNYHVEHHMFPLVPFHALPSLHELVKADCPTPYPSLWSAWKEIAPALLRQVSDPAYHIKRVLPPTRIDDLSKTKVGPELSEKPDQDGWLHVSSSASLKRSDVMRFDYGQRTFILVCDDRNKLYAMDGTCTHGNLHLSEGVVIGSTIECSKHNGRFNLSDGSPARVPICRGLATYPVKRCGDAVHVNILSPGGSGARTPNSMRFRVVSNNCVSTFIKEVVLEPFDAKALANFTPGDYIQVEIPTYDEIRFNTFDIPEPLASVWRHHRVFDLVAKNPLKAIRNNYSIASNLKRESFVRLNVRIATPPPGQLCDPGRGSSFMFSLRPGDIISALGPFGTFHPKPTMREMIYLGGGAGMAPLRAHLSHLLENEGSARRTSFWYGARSRQELFYEEYFEKLARTHSAFTFHIALSAPLPEDRWIGSTGFIHEVLLAEYLASHPNPAAVEYYLCGPPQMMKAAKRMLADLEVPPCQIASDEF
jgi:Na+-transporting NADH:ubiquinone oxidoreductase subunit F